jgi:hypothetical protein
MFERLDQIEARCEELTDALASPDIVNDSAKYQKTAKAHSEIAPVVEKYREFKDLTRGIAESKAMLVDEKDPEMRAYAQEELAKLEPRVGAIEEELKVLLLPKDPNDEKNIILEIRAGTGGGNFSHVHAFRGDSALESGNTFLLRVGGRRLERSNCHHRRQASFFPVEVRKRRASCPARSGHGAAGTGAHFRSHGCGAAGSRRC